MQWRVLLWQALIAACLLNVQGLLANAARSHKSPIQSHRSKHGAKVIRTARSGTNSDSVIVAKPEAATSKPSKGLLVKAAALSTLVVQNSALTISLRLSHVKSGPTHYVASTAVLVSEVLKLTFATIAYMLSDDCKDSPSAVLQDVFGNSTEIVQSSVPAGLYVLQNNLQFVATSNLPADVYQVLIQMKLITTALFAKYMMDKTLRKRQWGSIVSLFVGIALVQLSLQRGGKVLTDFNPMLGVSSVLLSCLTSGFAGIYYEKTLKQHPRSLWLRNIQLCTISILLAGVACLADLPKLLRGGFFQGYSLRLLRAISLQAVGGVLTSIVVKNTSSVAKGFATSASIILSCVLSAVFLKESEINIQFVVGAALVCISTIVYSKAAMRKPKPPTIDYTSEAAESNS